jgi:Pregnancy-associated plasma protein-A
MKKLIIIILLFGFYRSNGQGGECGTKTGDKPFIISKAEMDAFKSSLAINVPYSVKIFVTVFADDNGSNRAATDADILRQIQNMANQFQPHNICFTLMGIKQVNNSDLNLHTIAPVPNTTPPITDESGEIVPFIYAGAINIFIHNSLPDLNGIAYQIIGSNLSIWGGIFSEPQTGNISTLGHEMGHCLGLFHTFETFKGTKKENVARTGTCTNCTNNGDNLCDTPADNDTGVNASCLYTGTGTDACGAMFSPMVSNIMAYGFRPCRNIFTPGQGFVMNFFLQGGSLSTFIATDNISEPGFPFYVSNFFSGYSEQIARDFVEIGVQGSYTVTNSATQKIISRKITLKPGTRLQPTTGRVQITANPFCN